MNDAEGAALLAKYQLAFTLGASQRGISSTLQHENRRAAQATKVSSVDHWRANSTKFSLSTASPRP